MLYQTRMLAVLAISAVALFRAGPASAQCSLEERYLADCLKSKFLDEAIVVVREPRFRLSLPNLRVRDIDVNANGDVTLEVENEGASDAPAFEVLVYAARSLPSGMQSADFETTLQFPPLPSGDRIELFAGQLYIPDHEHNWDVYVIVLVDMMNLRSPGGQIWESNEEDNIQEYECRILGMPPDYSGPPPC